MTSDPEENYVNVFIDVNNLYQYHVISNIKGGSPNGDVQEIDNIYIGY